MNPGYVGESHGTCEETGKQHGRISVYREAVCMKSVVRNWRPYPSPKGKKKAYQLGEIVFLMGGVGEEHKYQY